MILHRLFELAEREKLLEDPAFVALPVPYIVKVGAKGQYLGIEERRGVTKIPVRKKGAPPKEKPDKGREIAVPKEHGSPNQLGFARFFADTLARVLPVSDETKSVKSRATFWKQISRALTETHDPALEAVAVFGAKLQSDAGLVERVRADVAQQRPAPGDRCTFAWDPDAGKTITERAAVRDWYRQFFQKVASAKQETGPRGLCQITGEIGPLPTAHAGKIGGVPGGISSGVALVSYDKAAFESYELDGAANAGIGHRAADGYLRALTAIMQNKLGSRAASRKVGNVLFLYWTREAADLNDLNQLDEPTADDVAHLMAAADKGAMSHAAHVNAFYCLALSGNAARAIVRDYLELPLPRVRANLGRWFQELRIVDAGYEGQGQVTSLFPLWILGASTAREMDDVPPDLIAQLRFAALKGQPLPDTVLAACLRRLSVEGSGGFRAPRLALVKLILTRKGAAVSEQLNPDEMHPAYLYGRLLAVFEDIQYAALGSVNATVVDKFYGTFSSAPALVFYRLYDNAQNHLRKLRGDKPGAFVNKDRLLTEITSRLPAKPPKGLLSLEDRGRFALGFYHQRAQRFADIAASKAERQDRFPTNA